jgi:hypothetical protein
VTLLYARLAEPGTLNSLAQEVQLSGSQLVRALDAQIDQNLRVPQTAPLRTGRHADLKPA